MLSLLLLGKIDIMKEIYFIKIILYLKINLTFFSRGKLNILKNLLFILKKKLTILNF
jgi:hypothetical protein